MTELAEPWSDKIIFTAWQRVVRYLQQANKEAWLPMRQAGARGGKGTFAEYGCGHFGCVMPTHDPTVVLKLTSDKSEAQFARLTLDHDDQPGIIPYYKVVQVEGAQRRGRPIYLLWRQAADDVGYLNRVHKQYAFQRHRWSELNYDTRSEIEGANALLNMKHWGADVQRRMEPAMRRRKSTEERLRFLEEVWEAYSRARESDLTPTKNQWGRYVLPSWMKGVQAIGFAAAQALLGMDDMYNNPVTYNIAEGCSYWMREEQILLADLHLGNIGTTIDTDDDPGGSAVIIDPGTALQVGPNNYPAPEIAVI